jgi:tetratricopeptide (TPR) repeat protein
MVKPRPISLMHTCRPFLLLVVLLLVGCGTPEERAQSYYERGEKLLSQQDYAKAGIEFRNALQLKKDLVPAWRGLAVIEERNQSWEPLIGILRTIVELDPKDAAAKLKLAQFLFYGNALDEALATVEAAGELDDRNPGVSALKGAIFLRLGDPRAAVREARRALEIDPANIEAVVVLAGERLARGDAEGALAILDRDPSVHDDNVGVQLLKVKILEQKGDLELAESSLQRLIELHPQEFVFRKQLIKFYVDHKRPDDALHVMRAMAAANPSDREASWDVIRFVRQYKGLAAASEEILTRINAGEKAVRYRIALAEIYFAQGKAADGILLLEQFAATTDSSEDAIAAKTKLAELHLNSRNFNAADSLVAEILRKDTNNPGAFGVRAALHLQRGQLDSAIADARRALNGQPQSTEFSSLLAVAYERSGSIELAEKQYADATKVSAFDPAVGLRQVAFLQRRGNLERAENLLNDLVARSPSDLNVLSTLAHFKLLRRDWLGAQELAERIRRRGEEHGQADLILGAALSGRNKYDDSIRVLQAAQMAAPDRVQPMTALVNTLRQAGKAEEAEALLRTILNSNARNAEAHVLLGSIQLGKKLPEVAAASFRSAIESDPENINGYRALADFHLRENNNDEALKVIRAALVQKPDNFAMRLLLSNVLILQGNHDEAIAELEMMLKQDPGSMIVANNLASLLADNRTDVASLERAHSVAAILRKTHVPAFKDTLGWLDYLKGDYKTSLELLEEAAAALPQSALTRYHLGMAYLATQQVDKATEHLRKASELDPSLSKKADTALIRSNR